MREVKVPEKAIEVVAQRRAREDGYNFQGSAYHLHYKPLAKMDLEAACSPELGDDQLVRRGDAMETVREAIFSWDGDSLVTQGHVDDLMEHIAHDFDNED